jgi:WD40 repeat protein
VAFTPDGNRIITGSGQPLQSGMSHPDFTVRLWDLSSGREVRRFEGHTHVVTSVAVSPDAQRILSGSYDQTMRLWDLVTGKELHCFRGHTERIRSVAFSPAGRWVASGSFDQTVRLWDLEAVTGGGGSRWFRPFRSVAGRRESYRLLGHTQPVTSVTFSPDGRRLLTGSADKTVRLWQVPEGAAS